MGGKRSTIIFQTLTPSIAKVASKKVHAPKAAKKVHAKKAHAKKAHPKKAAKKAHPKKAAAKKATKAWFWIAPHVNLIFSFYKLSFLQTIFFSILKS